MNSGEINKRTVILFSLTGIAMVMCYHPLKDLLEAPARSEYYSHILLIPFVSGCLIYLNRKKIFSRVEYDLEMGLVPLLLGIILYGAGFIFKDGINQNDYTAYVMLSTIVFWTGGFITLYGKEAFLLAKFPIIFLVFMIPIPTLLMEEIINILQIGSAEVTNILFRLTGIPVLREEMIFRLPEINIEVAQECSGIRSSLGLFITCILTAHFFLRSNWKKGILILSVLPITIIKNGIRILTLSLLAIYVDEGFLTDSFLHRSGGFVFYIPALGLLGMILWWLKSTEKSGISDEKRKENSV